MADLFPGGNSFIEYSFHDESGGNIPGMSFRNEISFELRGLDPASGGELWKRVYTRDSPVPYNDPQGGRLVLAWKANSESARNAAKRLSGVRDAYKNQKLKDQDSFFEVLDSLTGTPIGGVTGWRLAYEQDPDKGMALYFTPLKGAVDTHTLPIGIRWNPDAKRYQSLDRSYEHFLNEAGSLSTAHSSLR